MGAPVDATMASARNGTSDWAWWCMQPLVHAILALGKQKKVGVCEWGSSMVYRMGSTPTMTLPYSRAIHAPQTLREGVPFVPGHRLRCCPRQRHLQKALPSSIYVFCKYCLAGGLWGNVTYESGDNHSDAQPPEEQLLPRCSAVL